MSHADLVTIEKFAELTGLSCEAIRQYKKKGQWRE
jgi:DNA-binding transcriptional MerR regulator